MFHWIQSQFWGFRVRALRKLEELLGWEREFSWGNRNSSNAIYWNTKLTIANIFWVKRLRRNNLVNLMFTAWIFENFWLPRGKPKTSGLLREISHYFFVVSYSLILLLIIKYIFLQYKCLKFVFPILFQFLEKIKINII